MHAYTQNGEEDTVLRDDLKRVKKYTKKKVKVTDGKAVLDLSAYSAVYFGI